MPSPLRISVALCTYNGERFLEAQLASILRQSRLPDEVVVCDDRSTDSSVALLQAFAREAPFPVKVEINEATLGSTRNFEKAVALCEGDLIAFSDQDDLWSPERLAVSEKAFVTHPDAGLIFGNAPLIDDLDRPVGKTLWEHYQFSSTLRSRLISGDYLPCVQWRFVTGATVMVRKQPARACFPSGAGWIHDEWLAAALPLFADIVPLPDFLISYRLHASQQIGATRQRTLWNKVTGLFQLLFRPKEADTSHWSVLRMVERRTAVLCERFASSPLSDEGRKRLRDYQGYLQWLRLRLDLPIHRARRLPALVRSFAVYRRYSRGGSLLEDMLLPKIR